MQSLLGLMENLDPVYFGLNHYGWFTNIYDIKTGEDLLPR